MSALATPRAGPRATPTAAPGGEFLLERVASRGIPFEVTTPEGVPLTFLLARAGDRFAAFLVDALLIFLSLLAVVLLFVFVPFHGDALAWFLPFALIAIFLVRNFYFTWYECRKQGATPGKRRLGLRVVASGGGALTTEAVVVRNLMREVELWFPLSILLAPDTLWPDAPGWARLVAVLWTLVLAGFPLFNRRRLRVGDLVAGTMVVLRPRAVLLGDVGEAAVRAAMPLPRAKAGVAPAPAPAAAPAEPAYVFTDAQLDIYGNYELQVLEQVLRKGHALQQDRAALDAVAKKIRKKIGWQGPPERSYELFLQTFYAALRARLEHRMLLGKRKSDKYAK